MTGCLPATLNFTRNQPTRREVSFCQSQKSKLCVTGLQINQNDDFSITVGQTQYVKDIDPISIDKDRRKHLEEQINDQ